MIPSLRLLATVVVNCGGGGGDACVGVVALFFGTGMVVWVQRLDGGAQLANIPI